MPRAFVHTHTNHMSRGQRATAPAPAILLTPNICMRGCAQVPPYLVPFIQQLQVVQGNVLLSSDNGRFPIASTIGMFEQLEVIVGDLTITATSLTTLEGAFKRLRNVTGALTIFGNHRLASLAGAFPALRTLGGALRVFSNAKLAELGAAFPDLAAAASVAVTGESLALRGPVAAFSEAWDSGPRSCKRIAGMPNGFAWNTNGTSKCDAVAGVEDVYYPAQPNAPPVFKLHAATLPSGSDARLWYQQQCAAAGGLRPVQCGGSIYGPQAGTQYDFRAFGAVVLPVGTYGCNLSSNIMGKTGWKNVVTFLDTGYLGATNKGLCMGGCTAYPSGTPVHPICTL